MNSFELEKLMDDLIHLPHETEWVEFKEAKSQFDLENLGRYFLHLVMKPI